MELSIGLKLDCSNDLDSIPTYSIVNTNSVKSLVKNLACPQCKELSLTLNVSNKIGFAQKFCVECSYCTTVAETFTSDHNKQTFDVNRRVVKHFISNGQGFAALEKFCIVMNMGGMSSSTFSKYSKNLSQAAIEVGQINVEKARERVRQVYRELDQSRPSGADEILDLAVSYDGSWHKRGHTSNYGVGCIIELYTGLVIDYYVLSKYCHACALAKNDLGDDSPEFNVWFNGHKPDCSSNYDGSSPAMEVKCAEILWKRSLDYNFRYTTLLSDGDSKAFTHVQSLKIYGPEVTITKEECINHVAKRLRTGLKKVVADCKTKKITLGGSKYGSLKESTMIKLQKYYKNSILRNKGNVTQMKQDILATLHHCVSTDNAPKHSKCPKGASSWCFFNRAEAKGEKPGPHTTNLKTPITETVLRHIAPVYQRLASNELLSRCCKCLTQNANESLNSVIWSKCPKVRNVSSRAVEFAVAEAVGEYNFGSSSFASSMNNSGIKAGNVSLTLIHRRDKRRVKHAQLKNTTKFQEYRRKCQMLKTYRERKKKEAEGKTYGAGEF